MLFNVAVITIVSVTLDFSPLPPGCHQVIMTIKSFTLGIQYSRQTIALMIIACYHGDQSNYHYNGDMSTQRPSKGSRVTMLCYVGYIQMCGS